MRADNASVNLLWLSLALFVILTISFLLPIHPNDYWWYVRLGGEIVEGRAIPQVDTLSYTQAGQPVVYHSWLSALIFWGLHRLGGNALTILARGLVLANFYILVWMACRERGAGARLAAFLILMAALAGSSNWSVRPQLLVYPLFGLSLWAISRWQKGQNGYLWALPGAMALWVNLHGSFVLAYLLVGAALIGGGGDRKRLSAVLAAMLLASLINPRGIGAWGYLSTLVQDSSVQQFSREWQPPFNLGWQANLFFGWLLLFAPLAARSPRRLSPSDWLWFLGFGWLALGGVRHMIWMLAILPVLSSKLAAPLANALLDRPTGKVRPGLNLTIALGFILLPMLGLPGLRERWWPSAPPVLSADTPVEAVEWLSAHRDLPGPMWSELTFASYLTYALPERRVWIDTRFEVYPVEQWQRYLEISRAAPGWEAMLAEEGINLIMVNTSAQPELMAALEESTEWRERYRDEVAAIFTRATTN